VIHVEDLAWDVEVVDMSDKIEERFGAGELGLTLSEKSFVDRAPTC
jgi:hypothetical protein